MLYSIFFCDFCIRSYYSSVYKNYLTFRNVSKNRNETFYLHVSKIFRIFVVEIGEKRPFHSKIKEKSV